MDAIRQPRTVEAATALLEQWAELDGQIAAIEAGRRDAIAAINARADTAANDLIARREQIAAKVEPWWAKAADELTKGKRKSVELGGCMIGTREGRSTLQVSGEDKDVIAVLSGLRWAKKFLRVTTSLDRAAILKEVDGKRQVAFAELGISRKDGETVFYIQRTGQDGTRGGAGQ